MVFYFLLLNPTSLLLSRCPHSLPPCVLPFLILLFSRLSVFSSPSCCPAVGPQKVRLAVSRVSVKPGLNTLAHSVLARPGHNRAHTHDITAPALKPLLMSSFSWSSHLHQHFSRAWLCNLWFAFLHNCIGNQRRRRKKKGAIERMCTSHKTEVRPSDPPQWKSFPEVCSK